eukprot:UC4_evm2s622
MLCTSRTIRSVALLAIVLITLLLLGPEEEAYNTARGSSKKAKSLDPSFNVMKKKRAPKGTHIIFSTGCNVGCTEPCSRRAVFPLHAACTANTTIYHNISRLFIDLSRSFLYFVK